MIYVCLALADDIADIDKLLDKNISLREHQKRIKNPDLNQELFSLYLSGNTD